MLYRFEDFELDTARFELRRGGELLPAEPQVLSLLLLLAENHDRLVGKDEIVEKIWDGRAISDSALSSRIKSARKLLGDDGRSQRLIRTVHGVGFRFATEPEIHSASPPEARASVAEPDAPEAPPPPPKLAGGKPSIAVLPFRLIGVAGDYAALAEALPHELIASLSRLRWLFVIARGSTFRFRTADPDVRQIGEILGAGYCLSGAVEITGKRLKVTVELAETRTGGVLWGEQYAGEVGDVHEFRERIVSAIVSELDVHIPLNEARRARALPATSLDAWSSYHLGLNHMFRFTGRDNEIAQGLFEQALVRDPDFTRAHAGLSFTRFQNAFLGYRSDTEAEVAGARASAEAAMASDPLDPFANLVMGRTHWIEKDLGGSYHWLDRAVSLNPNYAQAVYLRALTQTMSGRGAQGEQDVDLAIRLSPLDPLHYAMLSTRGLTHILRDNYDEATHWAERAVRAPGVHVHITVIAGAARKLAGDDAAAARWIEAALKRDPEISADGFFRSFPFDDPTQRAKIEAVLKSLGL
ncbi:MAG: winged helix-turn-helix domain-containing protein [Hyphomonas sp.]|nr:winged helix-turn-helix domain-containing protein [Hyphomonas sp.]